MGGIYQPTDGVWDRTVAIPCAPIAIPIPLVRESIEEGGRSPSRDHAGLHVGLKEVHEIERKLWAEDAAALLYDTRHAAKVANMVSGVRSGLRVNSKTETFSNWT